MDNENESFFIDALSDRLAESVAPESLEDLPESRDTNHSQPMNTLDTTAESGLSKAISATGQMSNLAEERYAPTQAMLLFVMGEGRFSDSCELGVLNEHPEALKAITSNPCLPTSAFLKPALHAAIAELRPSMTVLVAVRLTAISLRLVADILPTQNPLAQDESIGENEQQKLAEIVRRELDRAVPYYHWQGSRNYCGRIQYLMALLEESILGMAVPRDSLAEALKLDLPAAYASQRVARTILDLGQSPEEVCGAWAAETLLSAWAPTKACQPHQCLTPDSSKVKESGVELAVSPNSESEDELPSPSEFVRRKPDMKVSQTSTEVEVRVPKAADNDVVNPGSAEDPLYISDSDSGDQSPKFNVRRSDLKASRHSYRSEARKEVNYSTRHHPQDKDLPAARKRRRVTQTEDDDAGARTPSAKRSRITDNRAAGGHH